MTFYGLTWVFWVRNIKRGMNVVPQSLECSINGNRSQFDLFRNIFKELNCAEFSWSVKQVRLDWKYWFGKNSITLVRKIEVGKIPKTFWSTLVYEVTFFISILIHYKRCSIWFCSTFEFWDQNQNLNYFVWNKFEVDQKSKWSQFLFFF